MKNSNKFTFANTYVKNLSSCNWCGNTQQDNYYGERYSYSYMGNYKFNLIMAWFWFRKRER